MVSSFRRRAAWIAALLVVSLSSVEMPHWGAEHHDPDFDLVLVAHDADAHHVTSDEGKESAPTGHCLACHWGRSFRPGVRADAVKAPVEPSRLALVPDQPFVPAGAPVAQPPLRSPPASPIPS
jgi:hypothetical protein